MGSGAFTLSIVIWLFSYLPFAYSSCPDLKYLVSGSYLNAASGVRSVEQGFVDGIYRRLQNESPDLTLRIIVKELSSREAGYLSSKTRRELLKVAVRQVNDPSVDLSSVGLVEGQLIDLESRMFSSVIKESAMGSEDESVVLVSGRFVATILQDIQARLPLATFEQELQKSKLRFLNVSNGDFISLRMQTHLGKLIFV